MNLRFVFKKSFFFFIKRTGHSRVFHDPMRPPTTISILVLGSGYNDGTRSLLLNTGITRYLINCGEGTQRALTEHKSKIARLQHLFVTQMSWDCLSGLLGVTLSIKSAGIKKLTVHGSPKIEEWIGVTRHFADSETTDVVSSDILSTPFVDNSFHVQAFPTTVTPSLPEPDLKRMKLDIDDTASRTTYAYFFQTIQPRLKLEKDKCLALGLPRHILESPAVRRLLDGEDLILSSGLSIPASAVTSPAPFTPNFLILDCPNAEFISALSENQNLLDALVKIPDDESLHAGVSVIIHFIPKGMFSSPEYQTFLKRLTDWLAAHSPNISETDPSLTSRLQHLVVDGSGCIPPVSGVYSQSTALHHFFDPDVYPLLFDMKSETQQKAILEATEEHPDPFAPVVFAQARMQYYFRPWIGFDTSDYGEFEKSRLLDKVFDPLYIVREEAEREFRKMHATVAENCPTIPSENYPEITFLGTGSSSPNKYRNISCVLIQLNPDDYIMLDCGEGTLNQLYTLHGPVKGASILRQLRLILVTHMHLDHHAGVLSVAISRARSLQLDPETAPSDLSSLSIPVLAPPAFSRWMKMFHGIYSHQTFVSLYIVPCVYESQSTPVNSMKSDGPFISEWKSLLERLKLEVHPIKVPHTGSSWAYLLRGQRSSSPDCSGDESRSWSLVYSGDTPVCPDLVEGGKHCDLLIHEATMIDQHEHLAVRAKHSTLGSAIRTGEQMEAGFILLTHFSQRYGRLPLLDTFSKKVATAFDFMKIKFSDLPRLPYYVPYYKFAFRKHWVIQQAKTEAYVWKKLRNKNLSTETNVEAQEMPKELRQCVAE